MLTWTNLFAEFYPYFRFLGADWTEKHEKFVEELALDPKPDPDPRRGTVDPGEWGKQKGSHSEVCRRIEVMLVSIMLRR